jgi:hypothetical protein
MKRALGRRSSDGNIVRSIKRITNIKPWRDAELNKAYRRTGAYWAKVEEIATSAQGQASFGN